MLAANNDLFYTRLPINEISISDLFSEEHLFFKIPANWHVLITDVKNSTAAINNGLHETINLVATGSIVALLNIAYKANISFPFFFGGDGATFIIPPILLQPAMGALLQHQENIKNNYGLELRVGHVPVADIYDQKQVLRISKLKTSELFAIPVLIGEGLVYAEKKIKAEDYINEPQPAAEGELDLSGMQCRWDRIKPPENSFEVVSLLVTAREGTKQSAVFKKVMDSLDKIYGEPQVRKPITTSRLKLKATLARISFEMRARMGGFRPLLILVNWMRTMLGFFYFKTRKGKVYLNNLVDMSDTLVIDGRINTVICGTAMQRELLETALNKIESKGDIWYGLCVSQESIMSCYVRNMNDRHVHFVDGADGGYTRAAGMLKKKMMTV